MDVWTIEQLWHMTREQLCELIDDMEHSLKGLEAGTVKRTNALASLENIRRVMLRKGFHP